MRYSIDYKQLYEVYKEQRAKSLKYIESRKGKVRKVDGRMISESSFKEFKTDLVSSLEDNPKISPKELAKRMAKDEVYSVTSAQARKFAEVAADLFGDEYNIGNVTKYRLGFTGPLFERIEQFKEEKRQEYLSRGEKLSSYKLNMLVGQEFFGSK